MSIYKADDKLAELLINHGFVENTSEIDKQKGKRRFKLSKRARIIVYFDYEDIKIMESSKIMDSCYQMSDKELKLLFFYFELSPAYRKEFTNSGIFNFKIMMEGLSRMTKEICALKEFDLKHSRQKKLEKIIGLYNSIEL